MLQSAKDHDTTYYTAIMGTTILIAMWLEPMISSGFGDPLPLGTAGILEQAFQFAYLLSTIRILQTMTTPVRSSSKDHKYGAAAS
jgi:hypothetical protein